MDSPLFKLAQTSADFMEMEEYLLASDFEPKSASKSNAQYMQYQSNAVPTIKVQHNTIPFVIAIHPETGKWYIPGTARYGQGLNSMQRVVKKFTMEGDDTVTSVAPPDDVTAREEILRLMDMAGQTNSALEPRATAQNKGRGESYRDLNNAHNRSIRFLNKMLQDYGFGDYEVWKGEKHRGSTKETYLRYSPLKSSFGFTTKGYEHTPKYHTYTRYAGDYGSVQPADLAAMIASHRGLGDKYPKQYQQILSRTTMNDPSWYDWKSTPASKTGSLKKSILGGDILPDGQDDALDKKTQPVEKEDETRLSGGTVPTEPPNQKSQRDALETAVEYEVGKTIEEKEAEVAAGEGLPKDEEGSSSSSKKVDIQRTPTQIIINIAEKGRR